MSEAYVMHYREPVPMRRWHAFRAGLLSTWEIVILMQDMIEAECVPSALLEQAAYLVSIGLCRVPDQMTYH